MNDQPWVEFLTWALPRLRMRWAGFRRVRGQVVKRIGRRIAELNLDGVHAYRAYLESHPGEWVILDSLCRVTISRFYRDRGVFEFLERRVLPELCAVAQRHGEPEVAVWSAGCGSGEEPYTVALMWVCALQSRFPKLGLRVVATDADATLLARAREGRYPESSVRDLPQLSRESGFEHAHGLYRIRDELRRHIVFELRDVRSPVSGGPFHLVLCRNLVFTYFETALQAELAEAFHAALESGGALVLGSHERLRSGVTGFGVWSEACRVYRKP